MPSSLKYLIGHYVALMLNGPGWNFLYLAPDRLIFVIFITQGNVDHFLALLENKITDIYSENSPDILLLGDINIDFKKSDNNTKKYSNFPKICSFHKLSLGLLVLRMLLVL